MKLTERLSPGVARGVFFARPGSLHTVFTSVVVGTASARRVARSTLLQVASSSSRPTPRTPLASARSAPCFSLFRPAQHPASPRFGPPRGQRCVCCTQCHAEARLRLSRGLARRDSFGSPACIAERVCFVFVVVVIAAAVSTAGARRVAQSMTSQREGTLGLRLPQST